MLEVLSRERTIAGPGFDRWLVPPAALAIHLSIGMAYGFSVFWLPLSHAIGITEPAPEDWKVSTLGWIYTLFFVVLGSSAALFGGWLERNGPRKAGVVAAFCWGGGFLISAVGIYYHQIVLLWIGSGVIGGCGLGLGYISPVSTLIKWFPDKRGMATGMAIMGFGGGAMIGAPLADILMQRFATPTSVGVWETFVTMGLLYFVAMLCGAFAYRVPPPGWRPANWPSRKPVTNELTTEGNVHVNTVHRTPQFWLLWMVLCLNVSAGIGVIGMASPMLQEVFGGRLIGVEMSLTDLTGEQRNHLATIGAGFAAILSLFNILGRIFWASLSDRIGRKWTYHIFFAGGMALYLAAALFGHTSVMFFVVVFCIILTMYGGGFATIPAYLADLFGTRYVGAIHGRLLTAWSTAGILGPVLITYLREYQLARGVPPEGAYTITLHILAGLLLVGFVCNLLVRPVADHHMMEEDDSEAQPQEAPERPARTATESPERAPEPQPAKSAPARWLKLGIAWAAVGLPLLWGIEKTLEQAMLLFR